jgi:hypothetical protein
MAWPTVTAQDIVNRWRSLSTEETSVATTRIADAEAELIMQLGLRGVTEPLDGEQWKAVFVSTVVEMVRRYLLNPDGWSSESVTIDDYREDYRRDKAAPTGSIYVTDDELSKLLPRRRRRAFTIRLGQT